jgi:predicted phosphodiesterase
MKKKIIIVLLGLFPIILTAQISIYNIQYTTSAGNGSYPSNYNNQTVTTGGIVTATNYLTGQFFISSSKGGAWNGLFVYDNNYSPVIGDSIQITGTVYEYQGYTEIKSLTSFNIISSGNPLPETTNIGTNEVTNEAYEGVLVELNNCSVSTEFDLGGAWWVNDGSNACEIRTGMYNLQDEEISLGLNYPFKSIKGVIGINSGSNSIHPRFIEDIQSDDHAFLVSVKDKSVYDNSNIELPIKIAILNQSESIGTYSLKIQYDETIFEYTGYSKTGTISETGTISDASTAGSIELNYSGSFTCDNIETMLKINFTPLQNGSSNIDLSGSTINGNEVQYLFTGKLENISTECDIPIGDTLTIVQRPLLNIPSIVIPGQELNIVCFAPELTTDWDADLIFDNIIVPLNVTKASYDAVLDKWTLTTTIPNVDTYELYDLKVTASEGISDNVTNAVKVIDQYKTDYYFVHITDTHLPTHEFYPDGTTDTTELNDLYEVIKDINLIRPEFVLLTGDLINEGELEDFECRRNHTRSIRLLERLEVPVYIVPGNHDLGGWDATPPSQGTARREWWRFFGWRQRELPPTQTEYFTHDYSFNYGNIHYVGLEAYDNYDSYMYNVFGSESFIPSQITWLKNDLQDANEMTKVLFYHFDFKNELNLASLGVDMALWGHTHKTAGDINSHPYNLSTASVCDGNRSFRVVRVNGDDLQAENPVRTHSNGDMLTLNYNMANDGSLDSISATVNNKYSQEFANGLVKFTMPLSEYGYSVTNGKLKQVITKDTTAICYIEVEIPSNKNITVSIKKELFTDKDIIYDIPLTFNIGE